VDSKPELWSVELPAAVDEWGIPWEREVRVEELDAVVDRRQQNGGESSGSDGKGWGIPRSDGNGR